MKRAKISIKKESSAVSLDKYAGEWVAFANGQVVAHGGSLRNLMEKVRGLKRVKKPSVLLVPKKSEGPYV
jgi:hypothetical protein